VSRFTSQAGCRWVTIPGDRGPAAVLHTRQCGAGLGSCRTVVREPVPFLRSLPFFFGAPYFYSRPHEAWYAMGRFSSVACPSPQVGTEQVADFNVKQGLSCVHVDKPSRNRFRRDSLAKAGHFLRFLNPIRRSDWGSNLHGIAA